MMTPEQSALLERIRVLLVDEPVVREASMFGGRSVMVNEKMIVSARSDGSLLVRVDADRHDELVARPGVARGQMGPGREMGRGWLAVAAGVVADDDQLSHWVGLAMDHQRSALRE